MVRQSQLFDEDDHGSLVPNTDFRVVQETSREAYRDIKSHPYELNGRYQEYLIELEEIGEPSTDQEVNFHAGHSDPNYFRPRRNELVKMGLVVKAGQRICRVTGKTAITWWLKRNENR